jgi:ribosome-associated toxin RatA of RatAB toxin-antitoxin module
MLADLVIGFRMIRERYTSLVTLQPLNTSMLPMSKARSGI